MTHPVERIIRAISPKWAFRREQYRRALSAYEAAKPSRLRKHGADNSSGDAVVGRAGPALRGYARQLEQNHDLARGVLSVLVNNVVGPHGISIESQPRNKDGDIHEDFASALQEARKDWILRPEVTWEHDYAAAERLACRTWLRDGELLVQELIGMVPRLNHGTRVPFSIELIEADLLPFDYDDERKGITQGVERNGWGRPLAYHIYRQHPGDDRIFFKLATKRVPADRMLHPKMVDRIRQARGVSVFAAVMRRLEDIKDYEESERVAARVAAALTAYIKKGMPEDYTAPDSGKKDRSFSMKPGMVFDGLLPGEEVGTIQSNRPSGLLEPFRDGQLRAVASGTGANYSSMSKNYNGTYSAQRQELVEGWGNYQALTSLFVSQFSRPIYRRFVDAAIASGVVRLPRDIDPLTIYDADFRGPAMPWIDPDKESKANERLERAGYKSAQQIIRDRGGNPSDTMRQIKRWRDEADRNALIFTTDPKHDKGQANEGPADAGLSDSEGEKNDAETVSNQGS